MSIPRLGVAILCAALLLVGPGVAPASADPVVTPGGGKVDTGIDVPGLPGFGGDEPGDPVAGGGNGQPVSNGPPPCTYRTLTPQEANSAGIPAPDGDPGNMRTDGVWLYEDCRPSGGGSRIYFVPSTSGAPGVPGIPTLTPAQLALQARNTLRLPPPAVAVNPDEVSGNPALVNLPTWWWVTNDGTLTQRTEAGPVWAQVTATPFATSWIDSRGGREDCASLGIAWGPWMQEDQPGSCRFSYDFASTSETATVESVWRVTWVGSGGSGGELEPMRVATTHTMAVYERHAIRVG